MAENLFFSIVACLKNYVKEAISCTMLLWLVSVGNKTWHSLFPRVISVREHISLFSTSRLPKLYMVMPNFLLSYYYFILGRARFSSIYPLMVESKIGM